MEDSTQALIMAFSVFVFMIALSLAIYMLSQVTSTAEVLTLYSDPTIYYENVDVKEAITDGNIDKYTERIVSAETIIPTLYRYSKEHFCVKIYDAPSGSNPPNLIQIFDINLENQVGKTVGVLKEKVNDAEGKIDFPGTKYSELDKIRYYALLKLYNNDILEPGAVPGSFEYRNYLFGVPWIGSTENVKQRVDLFINGEIGCINGYTVDYRNNDFANALKESKVGNPVKYKEKFISYSYTGDTYVTDEGDELTTGTKSKDKIVIMYIRVD